MTVYNCENCKKETPYLIHDKLCPACFDQIAFEEYRQKQIDEGAPTTIKAGDTFIITGWEYDDYAPHGIFTALRDINIEDMRIIYTAAHPDQTSLDNLEFCAWLTHNAYAAEIPFLDWYVSAYGMFGYMHLTTKKRT